MFVTRLKKQLFVESLVQGNMTVQVRLSACDVGGRRRRRGREGGSLVPRLYILHVYCLQYEQSVLGLVLGEEREREGKHSFILSYFLPLQEAKELMTYICT